MKKEIQNNNSITNHEKFCCFCSSNIENNLCTKCETQFIYFKNNNVYKLKESEDFLNKVQEVCKTLNIDKKFISLYIRNYGDILNIIEGVKITNLYDKHQMAISKNLKLKESIKKDILYNMLHYCIENNFNFIENKDISYLNPFYLNKEKFKLNIFLHYQPEEYINSYNDLLFFIEYDDNYILPTENCDIDDLTEEEINQLEDYRDNHLFYLDMFNFKCFYIKNIKISLTNDIKTNLKLIDNYINVEYEEYLNKLAEVRKYNLKFFKKEVIKEKMKKF